MEPNNSWTLKTLLRVFLDLALVYILLCISTLAFSVTKFLSLLNLVLPCPCKGILGFQNSNICWHKGVVDFPLRKIEHVKILVCRIIPVDSVWCVMLQLCRTWRSYNEFRESEGEVCSSSRFSVAESSSKKTVNRNRKVVFRRRKRLSVLCSDYYPSAESLESESVRDNGFHGELNRPDSFDMTDKCCSFDASNDDGGMEIDTFIEDRCITNSEENMCRGNEADLIKRLEEALEEEKAERAALYRELEEERAAAATAADQATQMISRLQEAKSSLEMEARQYHRTIEARIAYEEEEMENLKEIVISRDLKIHSLEKEVEAYRRSCSFDDDEVEGYPYDGTVYQS